MSVLQIGDRLAGMVVEEITTSSKTGHVTVTLRPKLFDEDLCSCAVREFAHTHPEDVAARTWRLP